MKKGDWVDTPRFCKVQIEKVFKASETARKYGFLEPTHYKDNQYNIWGKNIGENCMVFAAVQKAPLIPRHT